MSGPPPRKLTPHPGRKPTPASLRKLTPSPGRRTDVRFALALPLALRSGKRRLQLTSGDVSLGGLFAVTDENLPLRQLVRVELVLPSDGRPFAATGWVVHQRPLPARDASLRRTTVGEGTVGEATVGETGAEAAGVGVQFYGLGREEQARWDAFIERARFGAAPAPPMLEVARLPRGTLVPRRFARDAAQSAVIRVEFASDDDLRTALLRDVPRGAMFFLSDADLAVGDRVGVEVVHSATGDVFELEGRVRRRVLDQSIRGLEVKLAIDEERRARFAEFVLDPLDAIDLG